MPEYLITDEDGEHAAEVTRVGDTTYQVTLGDRSYLVDACEVEHGVCSFIVDGACYEVHVARERDLYTLLIGGEHHELIARNRRVRSAFTTGLGVAAGRQVIHSPMPGRVVRILVGEGDAVAKDAPVVVLEAMKMENQLRSPIDGQVAEVGVSEGQVVAMGEKLVVIE